MVTITKPRNCGRVEMSRREKVSGGRKKRGEVMGSGP